MGPSGGFRPGARAGALVVLCLALLGGLVAPAAARAAGWTVQGSGQPWLLGDVAVVGGGQAFALPMTLPAVLVDLGGDGQWVSRATTFSAASAVAAADAGHLWAVSGDAVYLSTDGGQTWQTSLTDTALTFSGISFSDALHGSAVGADDESSSVVYTTDDGGQTWSPTSVTGQIRQLDVVSALRSWAIAHVGDADVVVRSDDGGATWTQAGAWDKAQLLALSFSGDDAGAVSGTDDAGPFVATTSDAGADWTRSPTAFALTALSLADPTTGWAVARDAAGPGADAVYGSGDGGRRWALQYAAPGRLAAIAAVGSRVVAVGAAGFIVSYTGSGPSPSPDVTPPLVTASGYGGWHNRDVPVSFAGSDAASAVAFVQTRVDGGDITSTAGGRAGLTVAAPQDHSADGRHMIAFRAVDAAGNVGAWREVAVSIDTRPPTTKAPYEVGVKRSQTAVIPYAVADGAPSSGLTKVVLVVTTQSGRVVKRQTVAVPHSDAVRTAKVSLGVGVGFYRYKVLAWDAAGNAQSASPSSSGSLVVVRPTVTDSLGVRLVSGAALPYVNGSVLPKVDTGPHDAYGVRMYKIGSRLYNYPGGQARYGLANLNSYRITGDPFYLERATAQAMRLVQTHIEWSGAWYFPQPYTRDRHNEPGELMRAPWYGGMAQGQAMSLFVGMYEATGDKTYLQAAQKTLYSFVKPGPASQRPWTVTIDGSSHFWIQEWPRLPLDYTFNGHMISSFGLYDYYRVTGDTLALLLFRSAASTALDYAPRFRRPDSCSVYCLLHRIANTHYHEVHIDCLLQYYTLTGDPRFARMADLFRHDYWDPNVQGQVRIAPGTYTAAYFDANQRQRASKTVKITSAITVTCVKRQRVAGTVRLLTTTGPFAGYWLREQPYHVYFLGKLIPVGYDPARRITLLGGRAYTGRQVDADGAVTGALRAVVTSETFAHVTRRAVVDGVDSVLVSDGTWAGYWLPVAAVTLR